MDKFEPFSLKTFQESLSKISLEHHSFVHEHFLNIDSEFGLLAAKHKYEAARVWYREVTGSNPVEVAQRV